MTILTPIGSAKNSSRTLVFVRGFHGFNDLRSRLSRLGFNYPSRRHQTTWYRGLQRHGYEGQLFSYRWFSPAVDCFLSDFRSARLDDAAEDLWDLLQRYDIPLHTISLMGFSQGAAIIQRILRFARQASVRFRRVYLFGGAARRAARWPELLTSVTDGLWNFHSADDPILQSYHPDAIGLYGLPCFHPRARDIDCTSFVGDHDDWERHVEYCLYRARLTATHL